MTLSSPFYYFLFGDDRELHEFFVEPFLPRCLNLGGLVVGLGADSVGVVWRAS